MCGFNERQRRRFIPGLIDSHTHIIRHGNNFAMELRWDDVPSLADGLRMLKAQAQRTPAGQWIRVVGGWSADQFAERRLPTIDEINAVAPEVPVYVLHLYDRAWLNKAALAAIGIDKHFYEPFVAGRLERDDQGIPTGLALARPNAQPLYALLDMAPKLDFEQQVNSTRHYFRALNGLGLTSALDCAGGFLNYPDDHDAFLRCGFGGPWCSPATWPSRSASDSLNPSFKLSLIPCTSMVGHGPLASSVFHQGLAATAIVCGFNERQRRFAC